MDREFLWPIFLAKGSVDIGPNWKTLAAEDRAEFLDAPVNHEARPLGLVFLGKHP